MAPFEHPEENDQPLLDRVLNLQLQEWKSGGRRPVESYLEEFPELAADDSAVLDLIYQEFTFRRARQEPIGTMDFVDRFPAYAQAIAEQLVVGEAMGAWAAAALPRLDQTTVPGSSPLGSSESLPQFPGYDLLGELGRGGMGVVYKARERGLGRLVAIKTIAQSSMLRPGLVDRLRNEAEILARLNHPHVIQIHSIGEHNGTLYLVLEYAEGGGLDQFLAKRPISALQAANLVETAARAIHAAHLAGIIHRDLKPSNILLTADGTPKVADFSLAKLVDQGLVRTLSGEILGTPAYMSPEQARGRIRDLGPATDVYSLGAILYELIAGRPPFLGETVAETLRLVLESNPVEPRREHLGIPRDLQTIALKCLEKEPRLRYSTAHQLADDLRRFQDDKPIAAHPVGAAGKILRWARRSPILAATATALVLTFTIGTPTLFALWMQARSAQAHAEALRLRAEHERDLAERARNRALEAVKLALGYEPSPEQDSAEVRAYRRSILDTATRETQALVAELEQDPRAQLKLGEAQLLMAWLFARTGSTAEAARALAAAQQIAEQIHAQNPDSIEGLQLQAAALHRQAAITNDPASSIEAALASNQIYEKSSSNPQADVILNEIQIARNLHNAGHNSYAAGQPARAAAYFRQALLKIEAAARRRKPSFQERELAALCTLYLSRALASTPEQDEALRQGQAALAAYRTLHRENPASYETALQLVLAAEELSFRHRERDQNNLTARCLDEARATLRHAIQLNSRFVTHLVALNCLLARIDFNLCLALDSDPVRNYARRKEISGEAFRIGQQLELVLKPFPAQMGQITGYHALCQMDYATGDGRRLEVEFFERAVYYWEQVVRQEPGNLDGRVGLSLARRRLSQRLQEAGETASARDLERTWTRPIGENASHWYTAAADSAHRLEVLGRWDLPAPTPTILILREQLARESLLALHQAALHGFRDFAKLDADPQFARLRTLPDFQLIRAEVAAGQPFATDPRLSPVSAR